MTFYAGTGLVNAHLGSAPNAGASSNQYLDADIGPWPISSGVAVLATNNSSPTFKSADFSGPDGTGTAGTWSTGATTTDANVGNGQEAAWSDGSDLYLVAKDGSGVAGNQKIWKAPTGALVSASGTFAKAAPAAAAIYPHSYLERRSDGSWVLLYDTHGTTVSGTTYQRPRLMVSDAAGTTWTEYDVVNGSTTLSSDPAVARHYRACGLYRNPADDRLHMVWVDKTNRILWHRTLDASNAFGSWNTSGIHTFTSTGTTQTPESRVGRGVMVQTGGTYSLALPYRDRYDSVVSVAYLPSDGTSTAPTSTESVTVSAATNWAGDIRTNLLALAVCDDAHTASDLVLLVPITTAIKQVQRTSAGWGTEADFKNFGQSDQIEVYAHWIPGAQNIGAFYIRSGATWRFDYVYATQHVVPTARPYAWATIIG